ncbi:DedA family protein [Sulfurimonas sp. C5]|uniref:DedA family protein n=1 Tax=Sulfurimonas sp. C5 TaxID=3036947 RepID=UPI002457040E|nr:DedA family protein [Sulfurimonas sp. C5]MDH4945392.1 DedA family protein [Sulfurimonas sp. C5]
MLKELAQFLVDQIFEFGYPGIFILMAIESSFIPFPSEIVLVPAGYLASQEKMSIWLIAINAIGGSMVGALINYYLAYFVGRKFLQKFGKYFFIAEKTLHKMDVFFEKHGSVSTFTGRLIPAVRQLISIPAGLAHMNIVKFSIFTALGAGLWAMVLILLGYFIGENQELINQYLKQITFTIIILVIMFSIIYYKIKIKKAS